MPVVELTSHIDVKSTRASPRGRTRLRHCAVDASPTGTPPAIAATGRQAPGAVPCARTPQAPTILPTGGLRILQGTSPLDGLYEVSGSLDGVRLGDRVVRTLTVRRLGPGTTEGLRPLAAFRDLRRLHLERISGVDLTPLAGLDLEILDIQEVRDVDLAPLALLDGLNLLQLVSLQDCRVPARLALPASLTMLGAAFLPPEYSGEPLKALIAAVDWDGLPGLQALDLTGDPFAPIEVDLGFLAGLPRLVSLAIEEGIWHSGQRPSPLEPPFHRLPRTLRNVRIEAWEPAVVKQALQHYLPEAKIDVDQREHPDDDGDGDGEWELLPPKGSVREWSTYGSLWDAMDAGDDETEHDAMEAAKAKLRAADPQLLERLDFDHESDGTGVAAPTREDLARALQILGID